MDIIGKPRADLFPPEIAKRQHIYLKQVFKTGTQINRDNVAQFGKRKVWLNTILVPLKDSTGKVHSVMGVSRDLTAQRKIERALEESEARFRTLSESAAEAIAIHDQGIILDVNSTYCQLFGYEREEILGKNVLEFAAPESRDLVLEKVKQGYQKPYEAIGLRKDGTTFIGELIGKPVPYQGRTVRATVIRDITTRKRMERTLQLIMEGTSTATGVHFFKNLVQSIARVLETDVAFITRRDTTNPQVVRSLAIWQNGQIGENIEWEVKNTPCDRVIKGNSVIIPQNVQQKFPKDLMLQEMKAESYLAVPIWDASGNVVGHLGTLDSKPLQFPENLENIIQIFAVRAGTELQRLQLEEETESIFASNPLPIMVVSEDCTIHSCNTAAKEQCHISTEKITGLQIGDVLLCAHRQDDPKGCGFGPVCEKCITWNTIQDTFYDQQTRQGVESEMCLVVDNKPTNRTIRLNTSYFDSLVGARVIVVFDDITRQKRDQQEILRLKEFNESVLTGMAEGIVVMDVAGTIEYVNPACGTLLGYAEEELIGQHWSLIIPADQHPVVRAVDEERKKGIRSVYDLQLVRKDGRRIDVRVSGSPRFKGGKFIGTMAVFTDVTEQKKAMEALEASESFNRTVLTSVTEGVVVYDRQFRYVVWNSFMEFLTGYKAEDVLGKYAFDLFPFLKQQGVDKLLKRALKGETVKTPDMHFIIPGTDQEGWVISTYAPHRGVDGEIIGVVGLIRDITDRRQREEQLRSSEERYRSILENMEEGYYEVDLEGNFTFFNESLCKMLNYTKDELMGMNNRQYMDKKSAEKVFRIFNEVFRTGESSKAIDIKIKKSDGEEKFGEISVSLLRDRNNEIVGFRGIVRDITSRKQAEEEQRRSEENLKNLFQFTTDAIIIQNRKREILDCNIAAEKLFGYTKEELINDPTILLGDPEKTDEAKRIEYLELAIQGKPQHFEWWGKRKDGTSFPEEVILNRTVYNGEEVVFVTIRDITKRKQTEVALRENEAFLNGVLTSIQDGISVLDTDLTVRYVNDVVREWYSENLPLEGKKCFECYHNATKPCDPCPSLRCLKTGKAESDIIPGLPGSDVEWLELYSFPMKDVETGEVTSVVEYIRDITERKRAEKDISILANALRSIRECVSITDENDTLLFANEAFLQTYGYSQEEVIGHKIQEIVSSDKNPPNVVKEILQATIRGGWQGELINRRKDGSEFPISLSTSPIKNEEGEVIALIGVAEDITEQKAAQEQLLESEKSFRGLYDNASDAIYIQDRDGKFLDVNQGAVKMYGYPKDYFIGRTPEPLSAPGKNDMKKVAEYLKQAFEGKPQQFEFWGKRKNGEIFPKIVRLTKGVYFGQEVVIAFATDITERKRAERKLRESEEKFRSLFEESRDVIYISSSEGELIDINKAGEKLFGYTKEEMLAISGEQLYVNKDDRKRFLQQIKEQGFVEEFEVPLKKKDGTVIHCLVTTIKRKTAEGKEQLQGIIHDISKRKKVEEALRNKILDLDRANKLMVGRELRMIELKNEVNQLLEKAGLPKKYRAPEETEEFVLKTDKNMNTENKTEK
jgi:PAS domain S-box-containing protein